MQHTRPKNLNLFTIRFPLPAIVSICHRITGVLLFLFIPLAILALQYSLTENGFQQFRDWLGNKYIQILLWLFFIPFCFHFVAGIRHLLMDIHMGETLKGGKLTALLTFIISIALIILAGIWIW